MNNFSLLAANRLTHLKVVAVAFVFAMLVVGIGFAARVTDGSGNEATQTGTIPLLLQFFDPTGICRRAAGISSPSGPTINNLALILVNNDAHSEGPKMRKLLVSLLITGSLCLTFTPRTAVAGSGEVAAGIVGGLAVGTLFGAAVASGPRYYQPAPVYVAPAPVYVAPECYWTRGAPVWDGYRGIWYRPRIQVCD